MLQADVKCGGLIFQPDSVIITGLKTSWTEV